jgi:hypothetical protein
MGLILHCGAHKVSRHDVNQVPTPEPEYTVSESGTRTATHYPISHSLLIDTVTEKMEDAGLKIVKHVHSMTAAGQRYFGLMEIKMDDEWETKHGDVVKDYDLVIGLRNAHDKAYAAGFVGGTRVTVCDNLCFFGEVKIGRKHTRFIERDLPALVDKAVFKLTDARRTQDERIAWYKSHQLEHGQCHDLLVKALDSRIIAGSKLPKVLEQWRNPAHPEFAANGLSYWRLHNAFTEVLKPISLTDKATRTMKLNGLLDGASGLLSNRQVKLAPEPEHEIVDAEMEGVA